MGRLLLVELRRATARGVTRVLTLAGVLAILATGVITFLVVEPAESIRARAEAEHQRVSAGCIPASSTTTPPGPQTGPGTAPPPGTPATRFPRQPTCEDIERYRDERVERQLFTLREAWPTDTTVPSSAGPEPAMLEFGYLFQGFLVMPALLLLLGGIVAGASMVAAEWQAGSYTILLTWEPRRGRLLAARLLATAIVGSVIAVSLFGLFTAVLVPTATLKGAGLPDGAWWATYAGMVLRLSGLVGLASAVGGALAMIGRRTVFAAFAVIAYFIGLEIILRLLWAPVRPWLVLRNLVLVLGGDSWFPGSSAGQGAAALLGASAVIIAVAALAFRRRDFTASS